MRPASRSRSVVSARTCAARRCVSVSSCATRGGIRAIAEDLVHRKDMPQPLAGGFGLARNRKGRQGDRGEHRPNRIASRSELSSRRRLRGARKSGSVGVCSIAMGSSMDEIIENTSRIRQIPLSPWFKGNWRWSFAVGPAELWDAPNLQQSLSPK